MSDSAKGTLGYTYDMAKAIFGDDSPAVAFLEDKINRVPRGRDEPVIVDESQMIYLLTQLHAKVTKKAKG